ncbi:S8 pro-domain domain-containing protein [Aphis craccivora]|uniref:S8 pro-domain domain-containing protein n=1 Tax=Aphis craccivora TaxID=307492 RepID=A0A6G0ZDQ0_APHCR|nr:S8 pro-domain domain-containing protein [Aphis craccivora]
MILLFYVLNYCDYCEDLSTIIKTISIEQNIHESNKSLIPIAIRMKIRTIISLFPIVYFYNKLILIISISYFNKINHFMICSIDLKTVDHDSGTESDDEHSPDREPKSTKQGVPESTRLPSKLSYYDIMLLIDTQKIGEDNELTCHVN